jgi:hypothetical protein
MTFESEFRPSGRNSHSDRHYPRIDVEKTDQKLVLYWTTINERLTQVLMFNFLLYPLFCSLVKVKLIY